MNLKDEFVSICNEMMAPALDTVIEQNPIAYPFLVIFSAVGFVLLLMYMILYPVMKVLGWTNPKEGN